jgi:hypothetical protein
MEPDKTTGVTSNDPSRKGRWRLWIVLTVLMAVAIAAFAVFRAAYYGRKIYERPGFRFTALSCGNSVEIPMIAGPGGAQVPGTPVQGVTSRTWRADGVLFLEAVLIENCATPPKEGDFAIQGNTISLSYRLKDSGTSTTCNCPYRLSYEIAGIPRADYRIDFPASGKGLP